MTQMTIVLYVFCIYINVYDIILSGPLGVQAPDIISFPTNPLTLLTNKLKLNLFMYIIYNWKWLWGNCR